MDPSSGAGNVVESKDGLKHSPDVVVQDYFERFREALVQRMRARLGTADAEDAVQEVFLAAWRDILRYDAERSSPKTWLSRIGDQIHARNFRNHFRRQRLNGLALSKAQILPLSIEERVDLRQLLARLSPLNHKIITARFLLDESVEDISASCGLNEEAVRQRVSRSLKLLRRMASRPGPEADRTD